MMLGNAEEDLASGGLLCVWWRGVEEESEDAAKAEKKAARKRGLKASQGERRQW